MTRTRRLLRMLLADLFAFAVLHGLLSTVLYGIYQDVTLPFVSLALALPFFAMSFIRYRFGNIFIYVGCLILLAAWPMLMSLESVKMLITLIFMILCAIYSFAVRIMGGWSPDAGSVLVAAMANLAQIIFLEYNFVPSSVRPVTMLVSAWFLIMVLCYFMYSQTERIDESIDILHGAAKQPVKTMLMFNNVIVAAFLGVFIITAYLFLYLPFGSLIKELGNVLLIFLRWLFSLATPADTPQADIPQPQQPRQPSMIEMLRRIYPPKAKSALALLLEEIFLRFAQILLVALIVGAVAYLAYRIYKKYYASVNPDGDIREAIGPGLRNLFFENLRAELRQRLPHFGKSESEKIRRSYYKKVRGHIRKGTKVQSSDTAGEIANRIRPSEDIGMITGAYNRARYGNDDRSS